MTGSPRRAAVQVGGRTVRLACAAADDEPWLVAGRSGADTDPAELLDELLEPDLEELVVVHPAGWSATRVSACADRLTGWADWLCTVPAPRAAAGGGPRLVLDVGHSGTELTRLAADGTVLEHRVVDVGGASLDAVLAERLGPARDLAQARWIREQLSLLPSVETAPAGGAHVEVRAADLEPALATALRPAVDLLREALHAGADPVLLIGGVARAPLLAELADAAGAPELVVAAQPDAAAVLGALRSAAPAPTPSPGRDPPSAATPGAAPPPSPGAAPPTGPTDPTGPGGVGPPRSPWPGGRPGARPPPHGSAAAVGADHFPPSPRRPVRAVVIGLAATASAAGLLGLGAWAFPPDAGPAAAADGVLVQYGYRFDIPAGWEHAGGLPERRRVLLTRVATPEGREVIAVERTPLGYDADAERPRALAELRAEFDAAVAGGSTLADYRVDTEAGREVVRYQQRDPDGRSAVDWFVLLDGDAQFSVGCRHNPTGVGAVRAACALVVGSVRRG